MGQRVADVPCVGLPGVDKIYRYVRTHIVYERGGGVDCERRADDDHRIGLCGDACRRVEHGNGFAEEYDMRP